MNSQASPSISHSGTQFFSSLAFQLKGEHIGVLVCCWNTESGGELITRAHRFDCVGGPVVFIVAMIEL